MPTSRRRFLGTGARVAALAGFAGVVERARAIGPATRHGSLHDVRHIVVLTQENRSFDHAFGALPGVRGFADPFPLPVAADRSVWLQPRAAGGGFVAPFRLDTRAHPELMRCEGTPHTWPDAQQAWDHGRMAAWPAAKRDHAMAHYAPADLPFHTALADAFTLCDAYHCAFQGGTHPNRLFLMTGTNDPWGTGGGPAIYNDLEDFGAPDSHEAYRWTTYAERLEAAGVSWQVYQDLADNFNDNALAGFARFRAAFHRHAGHSPRLRERAAATGAAGAGGLDRLRDDVRADRLPQVSWIVGPAEASEHPWLSSPAQGADYIARVLAALTARPEVWAGTVLLINYDENDGFFDHMPPPAVPSRRADGTLAGASTVPTDGEYHLRLSDFHRETTESALLGRPYGLGPRVPMFVVSPWSRGGWVCSEPADHTSVIRFIEARFGVHEPNISAWRRSVCGDLTAAFDFRDHRPAIAGAPSPPLPPTQAAAQQARALPGRTVPVPPARPTAPVQPPGTRPARAVAQALAATVGPAAGGLRLALANTGRLGAVIHAVDRRAPTELPRRYTLAAGSSLSDDWRAAAEGYDLWLLSANGWHRHFAGAAADGEPRAELQVDPRGRHVAWQVHNPGRAPIVVDGSDLAYGAPPRRIEVPAGATRRLVLPLPDHRWYDAVLRCAAHPRWLRRAAGHAENGRPSVSDPAMHGPAALRQWNGVDARAARSDPA